MNKKNKSGGKLMNLINDLLQKYKKLHFSLINPDKYTPNEARQIATKCEEHGTNAIIVGDITVKNEKLVCDTIETIKNNIKLPIILFLNSAESISENVDYILFMSLLNSLESRYRGEVQAKCAPLVKKWGIKPISAGYVDRSLTVKEAGAGVGVDVCAGNVDRMANVVKCVISAVTVLATVLTLVGNITHF